LYNFNKNTLIWCCP